MFDRYEKLRSRSLAEHIADFQNFILAKGKTNKYAALQAARVTAALIARCDRKGNAIAEGCVFKRLGDLDGRAPA